MMGNCLQREQAFRRQKSIARKKLMNTRYCRNRKLQMLLNLVKIRCMDAPVFLDVASVINQYSLGGDVALGASWSDAVTGDSQTIGVTGRYADRPQSSIRPCPARALPSS
jgi:hypothetical protein